jgi:hypothetical protein
MITFVVLIPLAQLDLPIGRRLWKGRRHGRLWRAEDGVAVNRRAVGVLDGAEAGGYSCFAGGDGLAVASAVGALGQALAEAFDLADVGFAFVGVRGDGKDREAGGGGVQDEGDRLAFGLWLARAISWGRAASGEGFLGWVRPFLARWRRSASMTSARSIWSQAAPK